MYRKHFPNPVKEDLYHRVFKIHISMVIFIIPERIVMISADSTGSLFILLKIKKRI
jgi:hypothetical protein